MKLLSFGESLDNLITKMHLDGLSKDLKVERIEELFTQLNKFCPSDQAVYDKVAFLSFMGQVALNRIELRLCLFNVAAFFLQQEISISASNGSFWPLEFPMPRQGSISSHPGLGVEGKKEGKR